MPIPGAQHFPPELALQISTNVVVNTSWIIIERNATDENCGSPNIMKVTEVILMLMVTDLLTISSDKKVVNYLDRDFHTSHYLDTFYFVFLKKL